jgi:signal peptidase I
MSTIATIPHSSSVQAVRASHGEGVKDTIESLVVAFILAFVFRGFLVEAFVIPTGSMAPTLYGLHGTQVCPDCGWQYAYGMQQGSDRDEIMCPNCDRVCLHDEIPFHDGSRESKCSLLPERRRRLGTLLPAVDPERLARLDFEPQSGDRILVFKWPFDLGGNLGPVPWDVVVFKNPSDGENNYIKRLIGVPGEVLQIIDGDIYTCPVSELPAELLRDLEKVIETKYHMMTDPPNSRKEYLDLQRDVTRRLVPHLRIRRKTELAQKSLWHPVFHQDYLPLLPRERKPHWKREQGEGPWSTSEPIVLFTGRDASRQSIVFSGKDIEDYYAYNYNGSPVEQLQEVGDLRLKFVLGIEGGEGLIGLQLIRRDATFEVELAADGGVTLRRGTGSGDFEVIKSARIPRWSAGDLREVEFANVDYRVSLKVDGSLVLETTDAEYAPSESQLMGRGSRGGPRPGARIFAERLDLEIRHLQLDRDVFYRNARTSDGADWGTEGHPIYLREGEYYVLGDNSPASQDSRLWNIVGPHLKERGDSYQHGTVTEDQLIGKAFFVYWPNGYRIHSLPVLRSFGIIPNVGEMRWIR